LQSQNFSPSGFSDGSIFGTGQQTDHNHLKNYNAGNLTDQVRNNGGVVSKIEAARWNLVKHSRYIFGIKVDFLLIVTSLDHMSFF
jgi:hypothetical protein